MTTYNELESQLAAANKRITELEEQLTSPENEPGEPTQLDTARNAPGFDRDGRYEELINQGVDPTTAAETADYEQRTWNDRQGTSATG